LPIALPKILKIFFETKNSDLAGAALGIAAVILFERDEQKDNSGKPAPPFAGNAQVKKLVF
jgi:hypothetical protein